MLCCRGYRLSGNRLPPPPPPPPPPVPLSIIPSPSSAPCPPFISFPPHHHFLFLFLSPAAPLMSCPPPSCLIHPSLLVYFYIHPPLLVPSLLSPFPPPFSSFSYPLICTSFVSSSSPFSFTSFLSFLCPHSYPLLIFVVLLSLIFLVLLAGVSLDHEVECCESELAVKPSV